MPSASTHSIVLRVLTTGCFEALTLVLKSRYLVKDIPKLSMSAVIFFSLVCIQIVLTCARRILIDNKSALAQKMSWCCTGERPIPEPTMN